MSDQSNVQIVSTESIKILKSITPPEVNSDSDEPLYEPNSLYMVMSGDKTSFQFYCSTNDGMELIPHKDQQPRNYVEDHLRRVMTRNPRRIL